MPENHAPDGGIPSQQQATRNLAQELFQYILEAPSEFTSLQFTARYAGDFAQSSLLGFCSDGSEGWKGIRPPERNLDVATDRLRQAMYRPGTGTWFGIIMTISREGKVFMDFNYDNEPDFGREVHAGSFVADQKQFPRDAEHTHEWLARKLHEGRLNPPADKS